jgi:hypothetical protein
MHQLPAFGAWANPGAEALAMFDNDEAFVVECLDYVHQPLAVEAHEFCEGPQVFFAAFADLL